MIEIISPAGFENFFRELTEIASAGPPDLADLSALADRYGLETGRPAWLPDVINRFGLTPPPGFDDA